MLSLPICKYCGHNTLVWYGKEKAHVCLDCQRKLKLGMKLDIDLFWKPEQQSQLNKGGKT